MGFLENLLTVDGITAIVDAIRDYKDAKETSLRKNSPLCFEENLTQSDFAEIVRDAAKRTPRVEDAFTAGMTATLTVRSNSGLSTWKAEVDFNDYGQLTGKYWVDTQNSESIIPEYFAEAVKRTVIARHRQGAQNETK